jgi:hypothetical protein
VLLDDSLNFVAQHEWIEPPRDTTFIKKFGFEDVRLFSLNDELWAVMNVDSGNVERTCEMAIGRLDLHALTCSLAEFQTLRPGGPVRNEKNWMPVAHNNTIRAVYSADPTIVINENASETARDTPSLAMDHIRGGSQLVRHGDGFLALVHECAYLALRRHYLHRFIAFDNALRVVAISDAFTFFSEMIEFAAGLAWSANGAELIASVGVNDSSAWLVTFDATRVASSLRALPPDPSV